MFFPKHLSLSEVLQQVCQTETHFKFDKIQWEIDLNTHTVDQIDKVCRTLQLWGLVEQNRITYSDRIIFSFSRPKFYRDVEQERQRLGFWGKSPDAPRYSVCVCNYNMADTLDRAMSSVAGQLDPKLYEVLVIDDGSNDNSLEVLQNLTKKFPHFRYISLPRDRARRLGETRNISIRAARGEYVLIHIDADDEWEPYLSDLVTLFHKMEAAVGYDFLLAGQQTGIGKRDLLLSYGPYENIYRCEDRNMMMKLARQDLLKFLDYRVYRKRLPRPPRKKVEKNFRDLCSTIMFEIRQNEKEPYYYLKSLLAPWFWRHNGTYKSNILRSFLILPIFLVSRFYKPIRNHMTWQELRDYHEKHRGTYKEIMERLGHDPDISFLSARAQEIFSHQVKHLGFESPT